MLAGCQPTGSESEEPAPAPPPAIAWGSFRLPGSGPTEAHTLDLSPLPALGEVELVRLRPLGSSLPLEVLLVRLQPLGGLALSVALPLLPLFCCN